MLQKLIAGLTKHQSTLASLTIEGQSYTAASLIAALTERLNAMDAAQATKATWHTPRAGDLGGAAAPRGRWHRRRRLLS